MIPLTIEKYESHKEQTFYYIWRREFWYTQTKFFVKSEVKVITLENTMVMHKVYIIQDSVFKDILVVICNRPNYDDDFIRKEIANNLKNSEFKCLGKNTEKCTRFSIQM